MNRFDFMFSQHCDGYDKSIWSSDDVIKMTIDDLDCSQRDEQPYDEHVMTDLWRRLEATGAFTGRLDGLDTDHHNPTEFRLSLWVDGDLTVVAGRAAPDIWASQKACDELDAYEQLCRVFADAIGW